MITSSTHIINNKISTYKTKLHKATKEFENMFLAEMFQGMFKDESDSVAKNIYQSMLINEYAHIAAQKIGLAEKILNLTSKIGGNLNE